MNECPLCNVPKKMIIANEDIGEEFVVPLRPLNDDEELSAIFCPQCYIIFADPLLIMQLPSG